MAQAKKHILVIRLSAMGDVAISVPVIRALLNENPDIKITYLSKGHLEPLFQEFKNLRFVKADVTNTHKGFIGLYRLYKQLKKEKFYAIADLHNVLRSKILRFFFSFETVKIGSINKGRAEKRALTRSQNKSFKQLKPSYERYADVFRNLGFSLDLSKPKFPPKSNINAISLVKARKKNEIWIGIAPFAQYSSKIYPSDLLTQLIGQLHNELNTRIFLFGGGVNEVKLLDQLVKNDKKLISIAGKLNLEDELKLISNLDCMLSMDSANAHLAAMLGVKTISLWGVTHPFAGFAPFNQPNSYCILPDLVQYPKLPCSIYGNKVCPGYENVMRSIDPEMVARLIIKECGK